VDGAFDLFHMGHIELLKKARSLGDFLVVGVHEDQVLNAIKGSNYPVMNLHERVLSVMACRVRYYLR
jgi:ethanolamine-phosphate cytidylyltransferase